ncbi:MFS transporter [Alphaproteobacteria bacterium GH1-50]|uniref:MFS transporter n=1 Tax=Kangsaoukella pontilimi TaxID=2691042 RepID=A0A7C9IRX8_9RHOB|nr:MFS transporter [Kangsaoukella pontilimi]
MNVSALASGQFRRYLGGNVFALNALWMLRVTVGWIAWELTGSASFVGLVAFLYFAPTMVAGPLFGVLTDRIDIKRAAVLTQSTLMFLAASLSVLYGSGLLTPFGLLAYATLTGLTMSAHAPVRMSLAPRLVERDRIGSAVNLVAMNFNIARMTGPALAGYLIAEFGVFTCLLVTTVCYLPFILALATLRPRARQGQGTEKVRFFEALLAGFGYVRTDTNIRAALLIAALSSFFLRGIIEVLPILADGVFDRGASGLGLLTSAAGVGAVLGGLFLAILPGRPDGSVPPLIPALYALGLGVLSALGLFQVWGVAMALVAALAFVATVVSIFCQSAIQMQIDDTYRGRVMSIWAVVAIGSAALGSLAFGGLADVMTFRATALTMAGAGLAALIVRIAVRIARRG